MESSTKRKRSANNVNGEHSANDTKHVPDFIKYGHASLVTIPQENGSMSKFISNGWHQMDFRPDAFADTKVRMSDIIQMIQILTNDKTHIYPHIENIRNLAQYLVCEDKKAAATNSQHNQLEFYKQRLSDVIARRKVVDLSLRDISTCNPNETWQLLIKLNRMVTNTRSSLHAQTQWLFNPHSQFYLIHDLLHADLIPVHRAKEFVKDKNGFISMCLENPSFAMDVFGESFIDPLTSFVSELQEDKWSELDFERLFTFIEFGYGHKLSEQRKNQVRKMSVPPFKRRRLDRLLNSVPGRNRKIILQLLSDPENVLYMSKLFSDNPNHQQMAKRHWYNRLEGSEEYYRLESPAWNIFLSTAELSLLTQVFSFLNLSDLEELLNLSKTFGMSRVTAAISEAIKWKEKERLAALLQGIHGTHGKLTSAQLPHLYNKQIARMFQELMH